jgi:hypothetical protein
MVTQEVKNSVHFFSVQSILPFNFLINIFYIYFKNENKNQIPKDFFSNQITVHQKTEHRTLFLSLNSLENYMIQSMTGFGKANFAITNQKNNNRSKIPKQ